MLHPYGTTIIVACLNNLSAPFNCILVNSLWYRNPRRLNVVDKATGRGPEMRRFGIKWDYVNNDNKLHQQQVVEAWAEYGIKVHSGTGKWCWHRRKMSFQLSIERSCRYIVQSIIDEIILNWGSLFTLKCMKARPVAVSTTLSLLGFLYYKVFTKIQL